MNQPSPTIYTVAEHAGVSVATVSRVLQGSPATSSAARERVLTAVAELGYTPLRRSPRRPQTHGVVVPNLFERTWTELLLGMQDQIGTSQARMVLSCDGLGETAEIDAAVIELAAHTDSLVICESTASDAVVTELGERLPVVLVGRDGVGGCDQLLVDQQTPAETLIAGLGQLGRKRLALIGDPDAGQSLALRHQVLTELAAGNLLDCQTLTVPIDETGADQALPQLLAGDFDVALCATDELALRLLHVLVWRKVRVPDDLAVVGWGGLPAADYVVPRLTTVREPARELGRLAAAHCRDRLAGNPVRPATVLQPAVIWRESTGRPEER